MLWVSVYINVISKISKFLVGFVYGLDTIYVMVFILCDSLHSFNAHIQFVTLL